MKAHLEGCRIRVITLILGGLGAAFGVLALPAGAARASVMVNGTFGYVPWGDTTFTGSDLGHASNITLPDVLLVNTLPATFNGLANDFYGAGGTGIGSISPFPPPSVEVSRATMSVSNVNGGFYSVSLPDYLVFSSQSTSPGRYSFTITSMEWTRPSTTDTDLHFLAMGNFADSLGHFSADDRGALSGSFTQTGNGIANAAFTFSDPADPVPEPSSLVLLGTGVLGGLGCLWRRRKASSDR